MKNANLTLSIDPKVKALAVEASRADRRSISGLIEVLVLEHAPKIIAAQVQKGLHIQEQASA
jgi:hypothetical protein